ncbi:MAG: HEPN domain-containing protein [Nitrospirota bacterium]
MRKDTENFIKSAAYDLDTAEHMLKTGRYIYVVFMCHLSIEKMLKAVAAEVNDKTPPRTHNLLYLAKLAGLSFSNVHFEFISKINNASVVTRYPEDFGSLTESFPEEVVSAYLDKTREVVGWLKQTEKLR